MIRETLKSIKEKIMPEKTDAPKKETRTLEERIAALEAHVRELLGKAHSH